MDVELTKYDDCCYKVSIKKDGKEIETGVWCPQSHILAINGEMAGFCATKEEVIENLMVVQVPKYRCKHIYFRRKE